MSISTRVVLRTQDSGLSTQHWSYGVGLGVGLGVGVGVGRGGGGSIASSELTSVVSAGS